MIDAETGEVIQLTKSKWNGKEGRVNLDFKNIVSTGTGALSIKESDRRLLSAKPVTINRSSEPHPLLSKFIDEGPLNPMFHTRWNPRTGKVDPLPTKEVAKKKKKKKKKAIERQASEDDDSSVLMPADTDPFAFLTSSKKKTDLLGVVDQAVRRQSEAKALLTDIITDDLAGPDGDEVSEVSGDADSSVDTQSLDTLSLQEKEVMLKEKVFNQIFAIMDEVDDIRNPKPYKPEGWTKADKAQRRRQIEDRKMRLVEICEEIAELKVRGARELQQAILDEKAREKRRLEVESDLKKPNSSFAREVKRRHNEERERAKIYIRSLQYDNEVLLISKMRKEGVLW